MSETIQAQAAASLAQVERISAVVLPEPSTAIVPLADATPPVADAIRKRMSEINMGDTNSIVSFGSGAQAELQVISQAMLEGVRNKDVGPAGDSLRSIVTTIRGFSVGELDVRRQRLRSWLPQSTAAVWNFQKSFRRNCRAPRVNHRASAIQAQRFDRRIVGN